VSHLYLSPVAEAVTGSRHGYDVVDPAEVREELGGRSGLWHLARAARAAGLGLLLDLVPNHVSTVEPPRNPWWWSLLRDGPGSATAGYFDVDWEAGGGRVIVPVLGSPLDGALAGREIVVEGDRVRYHEQSFPLRGAVGPGRESGIGALDAQYYRLQHWAAPARNVRRFFTIDDLVAIRPEVPEVADAVHATALALAGDGLLDGVRIDHVDGLADPTGYLEDLRRQLGPEGWILVEKILVGGERLPAVWPVDGTTGYEWIDIVDHLFTHPDGRDAFAGAWREATGDARSYHDQEIAAMREVLDGGLRPDLERVARTAARELGATPEALLAPLAELTVHLGRYRTYLPAGGEARVVRRAAERARPALDDGAAELLDRLVDALVAGGETTRRWQQLTGPVMAKGAEDRALYRWLPMSAHNEVGGDPGRWSLGLDEFHAHCRRTAADHPTTLLAGSTHDTKRSEDVRARLLALAERPELWRSVVERWGSIVEGAGDPVTRVVGPARLLAFQTAIGAWPIDTARLGDYLVKAGREADVVTSWTEPDEEREAGRRALAALLTEGALAADVADVVGELAPAGRAVSLAQLAIRLTAPGVPDLYQGSESWLHTLVDPDNRADLDPGRLRAALDAAPLDGDVWAAAGPKAALIRTVLSLRRTESACFAAGSVHEPLRAGGRRADHVVAFARRPPGDGPGPAVLTVAARFPGSRPAGWGDTALALPDGASWRDALTGRRFDAGPVPLDELLGRRPAAVLAATPRRGDREPGGGQPRRH